MWGALLGASGYVPLPLAGADYLELLPVRFHPVTGRGIRINYRTYDHACLNEHRGRPSPTGPRGKWEIHLNLHDVRQVYIRLPDGRLHEIPWNHRDHVHTPMSETTWRHIRATLTQRSDRDKHEADLAEAVDRLVRRARPLPAPAPAPPATAPPGAASAAAHALTMTSHYAAEAEDSIDAAEPLARDEDGIKADGEKASPPARFALYDAFEEAKHW
ncbi:hypothetical protein A6P39_000515 [Streptomyces sp. FXJ1.172]|uniref:hypothetical protein n=1 Tax=Streptomyces sp. FXJ1.172 TaxID=710705 RepID=UPI0007D006AD